MNEYREAATALPLSLEPLAPPASIKSRVLQSCTGPVERSAPVFTRLFWAAAAVALIGFIVVSLRNTPEARDVALRGTPDAPQAHGTLHLVGPAADLVVSGLPKLPEGKVYQLWHIGGNKIPVPQNLFGQDSAGDLHGSDRIKSPVAANHIFAITMEPAGGSRKPTLPIYAVGTY